MSKRVFDIIFKTKGLGKATSGLKGLGSGLGKLVKGAALAGAGIAALSVKLAGDFQKSLKEVGTLMKRTSDKQMKDMSRELRHLSQVSGLALSSLSKAKYDVVSAGFAGAADSAKILGATTRLAVGGVTSAATAADILTTALNAYGKDAKEVDDVSNILFTTVRLGKTTMDELGASLGTVLPVARAAGLEFDAVGAAMASMTAGGIGTAEATTALRGAINALTAPVGASKKAMSEAGISAKRYADGSLDLLETIKQFEGMDPATLRKFIPDIRAGLAISALAQNIDGLANNLAAFQKRSGATDRAFKDMMGTFNNQMNSLKNSSQSIMIEIGNVIIEAITPSIKKANEALKTLGEIGFDEVAKRLAENFDKLKMIVVQSANIVKDELIIVGMKARNSLPFWLGGGKDEVQDAIAMQRQSINASMNLIKTLVDSVVQDVSRPPELSTEGWGEWADDMDDMWASLGPEFNSGPVEIFSEEDLDFARDMTGQFETFGLTLAQAKINADEVGLSMEEYAISLEMAAKKGQEQADQEKARHASNRKAMEETAKAAALNATSAEDAAERIVRAAFMEALARQISNIMVKVPFPLNLAVAAGAGAFMTGLFDQGVAQVKKIKMAEHGMDEVVSKPTLIMAGEAGPERVQVTPRGRSSSSQGGLTVNFNGPVTNKDFVRDTVIPEIQRVQKLGLA